MSSIDSTPLQTAALPFILPWKGRDPALEVVSLGAAPEGWERLLGGQGIASRGGAGEVPAGCRVAAGFDRLDSLTETTLATWAEAALAAFDPGGILVLGGTLPGAAPAGRAALSPQRAAHLLKAAGFARCRILGPAEPLYAVVAQAPALGAAFDVFSPVFLATPPPSGTTPAAEAEAALGQRLRQLENDLRARADRAEATLHDRLHRAETRLEDQAAEITRLQDRIVELQRLTRRRGLRKLAHRIKEARRKGRDLAAPEDTPPPLQAAAPSSAPSPAAPPRTANPAPLSDRERAVEARLFGTGAG